MRLTSDKRRSLRAADEGVALVLVMGVLALVTTLVTGGFVISQQALHESERVNKETQAFQAANAGLDGVVAKIQYQGFDTADYPLHLTAAQTGAGESTVTAELVGKNEYLLVSTGRGRDNTTETVRVRMYFLDLYGMNVSSGAKLDANASNGKINGTTTIYGPLFTNGSLDSSNLGNGSGGIKWGPLMVKDGNVDSSGDYIDVGTIYYEPPHTVSVGTNPQPKMIASVPKFVVPPVDSTYLQAALGRAQSESADNNQGPLLSRPGITNTEVRTKGDSASYNTTSPIAHNRPPGSISTYSGNAGAYKVIDNDGVINRSHTSGLVLGPTTFGTATDDFAFDGTTLTCWGTVFIDGPLITTKAINYVGKGIIVVNGPITLNFDFVPQGGLTPGLGGNNGTTTYAQ